MRPASPPPRRALRRFDADGRPIRLGPMKLTSMGQGPQGISDPLRGRGDRSPRLPGTSRRHDPLPARPGRADRRQFDAAVRPDDRAQVRRNSAPRGSLNDLAESHGRRVAKAFVQDVADAVAAVALAKEEDWEYELPEFQGAGGDGHRRPGRDLHADGARRPGARRWSARSVFYNAAGERLHTVYAAATPEYGKLTFFERFDREVGRAKAACPEACYVGLADGAKENWTYLDAVTELQVVDFYHAAGYLWPAGRGAVRSARRRGGGLGRGVAGTACATSRAPPRR